MGNQTIIAQPFSLSSIYSKSSEKKECLAADFSSGVQFWKIRKCVFTTFSSTIGMPRFKILFRLVNEIGLIFFIFNLPACWSFASQPLLRDWIKKKCLIPVLLSIQMYAKFQSPISTGSGWKNNNGILLPHTNIQMEL